MAATATPAHRSRLVAYLLLAAACGGLFVKALALPASRWEPLGAGTFPAILLAVLTGLCLLGAVLEALSPKGARSSVRAWLVAHRLVLTTAAAFALFVLLLPQLGFPLASFFFLLGVQLHLAPWSVRSGVLALVLAFVFSYGLAWLFADVFEIFLPTGLLWR